MIRAKIESWTGNWRTLDAEQYAELREHVGLPEEKPEYLHEGVWMDREALLVCAKLGISITPDEDSSTNTMLVKLADRVEALSAATAERVANGSAVTIAIPDIGLMTMRSITVLSNSCTDEVQRYLNEGWRLLAICPPNAQRRPDYVLGHHDKDASE